MRRDLEPALSMSSGPGQSGVREKIRKPLLSFKRSKAHWIVERRRVEYPGDASRSASRFFFAIQRYCQFWTTQNGWVGFRCCPAKPRAYLFDSIAPYEVGGPIFPRRSCRAHSRPSARRSAQTEPRGTEDGLIAGASTDDRRFVQEVPLFSLYHAAMNCNDLRPYRPLKPGADVHGGLLRSRIC